MWHTLWQSLESQDGDLKWTLAHLADETHATPAGKMGSRVGSAKSGTQKVAIIITINQGQ